MKILLATLHVRPSAQATPLAAACLKAALAEEFRAETTLIDLFLDQSPDQMLDAIDTKQKPDIVAFPLYLWNRNQVLSLARHLHLKRPELLLVAGGPEASADTRAVQLEGTLDAVIRGEGEAVFASLVSNLAAGLPIDQLPGVYTPGGELPGPVYCENLDQLPSPYLQQVLLPERGGGLLWEVARGCPFNCSFCYDAKGHRGVRPFASKRLEQELRLFVARGTEQIWVLDSTFNFPRDRGRRLLELLLKTAPQIHYHLEAKAEFLDDETIDLLSKLRCSVQIGLQSADPQVLQPLQRSFDPGQLFDRLQKLSDAGVVFGLDLIYGLPGDTHTGFRDSLNRALKAGPNQLDMFPLAILPGTRLFLERDKLHLQSMPAPPYEIYSTPDYPPQALAKSRLLSAATDIFYNRGRAVGFLLPACQALRIRPVSLLERFSSWLLQSQKIPLEQILAVENWTPAQIFPLQQEFLATELKHCGKPQLQPLVNDLLRYHYHYAETLLGPEINPQRPVKADKKAWKQCWKQARDLRLVAFNYELDELTSMDGLTLEDAYQVLNPSGSTGIFIRRGDEVLCESLQEDFARLLQDSDGTRTPAEILPEYPPAEGLELLSFALEEGLLCH